MWRHHAGMTAVDLRAWKEKHDLTVAELAWVANRSERGVERKLCGEIRRCGRI
jgi:hypothetical protein